MKPDYLRRIFGISMLSACLSGCSTGTGSKRFSFDARIAGAETPTADVGSFVNQKGWSVSLSEATVTIGPIYLNTIVPLADTTARVFDWLVRPAWAHGAGHLDSGRIVGEVLSRVTFDALSAEPVDFPSRGNVTQEEVRSAEVWFYPTSGSSQVPVALSVRGEASKEGVQVRFRGELTLNEDFVPNQAEGSRGVQTLDALRKVRGIPAGFVPTEGGSLEIRLDVRRLFRGADFSSLESNRSDADGTKVLAQGKTSALGTDQVMTNLYQGLREANGTYAVRWIDPEN